MTLPQPERDIVAKRFFDAPRERIWQAFADPEALAKWWGPAGFTNVFQLFDLRPGGEWRFTMRGPDGAEYPMLKVFLEVDAPGRIVFEHPDPAHGHRLFLDFQESGTGTEVSWLMRFDSPEEAARVRAFVEVANGQNFDRLAAHLDSADSRP
jgi:uncharacterized protein YndB with AHSA1/START domain